ncbi:MAG TPA: PfkB family carbohydrate kinase [Phototrophicaceae bacterium]|nr:PfkB family carbohydrate kinase [Phototrophicaceae bacterium]
MAEGHVLVIGSAATNITALAPEPLLWDSANLGEVHNSVGGVARNIAENLARLEVETLLLTAVGRDVPGRRVIRQSKDRGVNCQHVRAVRDARTCTVVSVLKNETAPLLSISDFAAMEYVDSDYLWKHEPLFEQADMIVIDTTLSERALSTLFELVDRYNVRVCADPTSPTLAGRLCDYLPMLYMVAPNAAETTALCGLPDPAQTRESAIDAARHLVSLGVEIAVVTLGAQGVAYADGSGAGFIRAVNTKVVDATGAGDAFSAAVIFGLLNGVQIDEAMRLGMTAAALTLQSTETVLPELSQELLYDKLVV